MKSQLLYLVAIGTVLKSNGGQLTHGDCVASFDSDMTPQQIKEMDEVLACANLSLCDKPIFDAEH